MKRSKITRNTSRAELVVIVENALRRAEIDAVLVGGSVVALYTREEYVTDDLDFVSYQPLKKIAPVMRQLGFTLIGNRAIHKDTDLYLQFCAPPLAVGRAPVTPVELKTRYGKVNALSPTDCVLDRLMKFYYWDDIQGLEQALLVARVRKIDLPRVRELSKQEGKLEQFEIFQAKLQASARKT